MNYLLGIDIGLTKTKAVKFDKEGNFIAKAERATPLSGDEIDMELLWQRVQECIDEISIENVSAISVSGHGNGFYAIDQNGESFMPAISSMTTRPTKIQQGSWAGQTKTLLEYFKDEKRIHKIMFCKDWINYKLTGNLTTDYTDTSAGGVSGDALPPIVKSTDCVGCYKGIPVTGGMFDVNACVIGSGLTMPDKYSIISGTWGINSCITKEFVDNDNILQCCTFADSKNYICIESAPTSSVNLEWFIQNILGGMDYEAVNKLVEGVNTDIIYLPYIYGSTKNASLNGAFLNLNASHTTAHMLRAIYEGVAMGHRLQIEQLKKAGLNYNSAILSGGASNSSIWCQIFSDVTGLEIEVSTEKQAGALGGAICGAVMLGIYADLSEAAKAMTEKGEKYYPNYGFEDKYKKFRDVVSKWTLD